MGLRQSGVGGGGPGSVQGSRSRCGATLRAHTLRQSIAGVQPTPRRPGGQGPEGVLTRGSGAHVSWTVPEDGGRSRAPGERVQSQPRQLQV